MEELNKMIEEINTNHKKGITRKLDELGRIVIPIEYRSEIVEEGETYVEVYQVGKYVVVEILKGKFDKKRKFDELGRIVVNIEIRERLNWLEKDKIEMWNYNYKYFILRKVEKECVFCFSEKNLTEFKRTMMCDTCKKELLESEKDV